MVAHAAGESFYLYARACSSVEERSRKGEVGGSHAIHAHQCLSSSVKEHLDLTGRSQVRVLPEAPLATVVILGARSEARLKKLEALLLSADVRHSAIREPDAPYDNALMAVGLVPAARGDVARYVKEFHLFPGIAYTAPLT